MFSSYGSYCVPLCDMLCFAILRGDALRCNVIQCAVILCVLRWCTENGETGSTWLYTTLVPPMSLCAAASAGLLATAVAIGTDAICITTASAITSTHTVALGLQLSRPLHLLLPTVATTGHRSHWFPITTNTASTIAIVICQCTDYNYQNHY